MWRGLAWVGFTVEYFLITFIGIFAWIIIVLLVEAIRRWLYPNEEQKG
jgi:hypothetical protein